MASSPTHAMRKRDEGGLASAVQASTGRGRVGLAVGLAVGLHVFTLPRHSVRSRARGGQLDWRQAGSCRQVWTGVSRQRLASERSWA